MIWDVKNKRLPKELRWELIINHIDKLAKYFINIITPDMYKDHMGNEEQCCLTIISGMS